jgi:hypothetical protein
MTTQAELDTLKAWRPPATDAGWKAQIKAAAATTIAKEKIAEEAQRHRAKAAHYAADRARAPAVEQARRAEIRASLEGYERDDMAPYASLDEWANALYAEWLRDLEYRELMQLKVAQLLEKELTFRG